MRLIDADELYEKFTDNNRVISKGQVRAIIKAAREVPRVINNGASLDDGQVVIGKDQLSKMEKCIVMQEKEIKALEKSLVALAKKLGGQVDG